MSGSLPFNHVIETGLSPGKRTPPSLLTSLSIHQYMNQQFADRSIDRIE